MSARPVPEGVDAAVFAQRVIGGLALSDADIGEAAFLFRPFAALSSVGAGHQQGRFHLSRAETVGEFQAMAECSVMMF
jgi:hypothetical protein